MEFYNKKINILLGELASSERGLTADSIQKKQEEYGLNKLPEKKPERLIYIFFRQFKSPLIYILLAASLIVFLLGDIADGFIILVVVLFNSVIGSVQEGKAQHTLAALQRFTETTVLVIRNNKEVIIPDSELVPGDILILREGDKIGADARLFHTDELYMDESSLTGESNSVLKNSELLNKKNLPTSDQKNMVFRGTFVVGGYGKALIVATGSDTVIGIIGSKLEEISTETPLKTNIRFLSKIISIAIIGLTVIIFFIGIAGGNDPNTMFTTAVAIAVAAIPEGLPVVVTLILAKGVWRMGKQNALVKRLQAVDALGQADIIAVDKTGTITKNQMMVKSFYVNGTMYNVNGSGYEPTGTIMHDDSTVSPLEHPEILLMGKISAFNADAAVAYSEETQQWIKTVGDPTEAALVVLAKKIGYEKDSIEEENPAISKIPFISTNGYHASVNNIDGTHMLSVSGIPEKIMEMSDSIWEDGNERKMNIEDKESIKKMLKKMSRKGLRVLAFGINSTPPEHVTADSMPKLSFVGFIGISDTIRPEIYNSIQKAETVGMRVVMITGDFADTAKAIAKEVGIYKEGDRVLSGTDLNAMDDMELQNTVASVSVFARVTPEHKLRIIQAYKANKKIIAMTGDGVNDTLSLAAADLGISMGKIGTEVAKEASDIILLDDNFGSIVSAIEEGRNIYRTIKKVISYLFSTNLGELAVIIVAISIGWPLPILASQIIWLNMITDGFLVIALALEPKDSDLLKKNFVRPTKRIIDNTMLQSMSLVTLVMTFGTLYLFSNYFTVDLVKATTIALTSLAVFQWFNAWNSRSESVSIFKMNIYKNKYLFYGTFLVLGLQLLAVYTPFMQRILHTTALTLREWILIVIVALSVVVIEEIRKVFLRFSQKNKLMRTT
ncbi:ATPase [Candidatus Wolfebacteria bacterium]|nr:MAG: ATPase [Candidatus Wolfebacteria bacterium]